MFLYIKWGCNSLRSNRDMGYTHYIEMEHETNYVETNNDIDLGRG
jgi:hypothetical protein